MCESTGRRRDAASVIFDLPGYRVIGAVDLPLNGCRVIVKADQVADGCLVCGWFPGGPMYGSVSESQTSPVPGVSSSWSSPGWCVRNRPAHGAPSLRPPPSSTAAIASCWFAVDEVWQWVLKLGVPVPASRNPPGSASRGLKLGHDPVATPGTGPFGIFANAGFVVLGELTTLLGVRVEDSKSPSSRSSHSMVACEALCPS